MVYPKNKISVLIRKIDSILSDFHQYETLFSAILKKVHPNYKEEAANLIHYFAFRHHDVTSLQHSLGELGLSHLSKIEGHIYQSLISTKYLLHLLNNEKIIFPVGYKQKPFSEFDEILENHTKALLGNKPKGRRSRIMVTLPSESADNYSLILKLVSSGMNCARINCARDTEKNWKKMIDHVKHACKTTGRSCKVAMDLAGPKLRTGSIKPGPKVIQIKPERNSIGELVNPANIWLAPPNIDPPYPVDAFIPLPASWIKHVKKGDEIEFMDSRGKVRRLKVRKRKGKGRLVRGYDTAYITPGTKFTLIKKKELELEANNESEKRAKPSQKFTEVGELLPLEQRILLKRNDTLILHKKPIPGEPSQYDSEGNLTKPAHISCTLPQIFDDVKTGEPILFDDGAIEGIIREVKPDELAIEITFVKDNAYKLGADKGINLPESNLSFSGLTAKDKKDFAFITKYADIVSLSFIKDLKDVDDLHKLMKKHNSKVGVVFKIETKQAYKNLPLILLAGMKTYPIGVMIARGDLAVECGWKDMAKVQEEILMFCSAARIPAIWATQVLENLAKKGMPSRAEITDAAKSQSAECVMLNKGPHIIEAINLLNEILVDMQDYRKKMAPVSPIIDQICNLRL